MDGDWNKLKDLGRASRTFYFKQFGVKDDRSTMKVGTDAVLLGAAVDVSGAASILEIGTGCGVISLMLAQRSKAFIDAIDIDEDSVIQARENVCASPWQERISVIHSSLQEFAGTSPKTYDLLVANPPYFTGSLKSPSPKKNLSRHDQSLGYDDLLRYSERILSPRGSLWVILPETKSDIFIMTAGKHHLFPGKLLYISPKPNTRSQLVIIRLDKKGLTVPEEHTLQIRDENNSYSIDYKRLTEEFYLDF